ncbi:hypothetical protein BDQ17DRAFT_1420762 [Cyathus striatus]|nr:hypothetical protein BDQ17DRAFT_1420762 [Cyathus striatus]
MGRARENNRGLQPFSIFTLAGETEYHGDTAAAIAMILKIKANTTADDDVDGADETSAKPALNHEDQQLAVHSDVVGTLLSLRGGTQSKVSVCPPIVLIHILIVTIIRLVSAAIDVWPQKHQRPYPSPTNTSSPLGLDEETSSESATIRATLPAYSGLLYSSLYIPQLCSAAPSSLYSHHLTTAPFNGSSYTNSTRHDSYPLPHPDNPGLASLCKSVAPAPL